MAALLGNAGNVEYGFDTALALSRGDICGETVAGIGIHRTGHGHITAVAALEVFVIKVNLVQTLVFARKPKILLLLVEQIPADTQRLCDNRLHVNVKFDCLGIVPAGIGC